MAKVDYRPFGEAFGSGLGRPDASVPVGFLDYSNPTPTSASLSFADGSVFLLEGQNLQFQANGAGGLDLIGGTVTTLTQTYNGITYAVVSDLDATATELDRVLDLQQTDLFRLFTRENDRILGTNYDDVIYGWKGADILKGFAGADTFIYRAKNESGTTASTRDTLADFRKREGDQIDLSGIDAKAGKPGNQAFKFIDDDEFNGVRGELRADIRNRVTVVEGDMNGDGSADFSIALANRVNLDADQFIL